MILSPCVGKRGTTLPGYMERGYKNVEDFILDESFHEYVKGQPQASVNFWNSWVADHPAQETAVATAKNMLATLFDAQKAEVTIDKQQALKKLMRRIHQEEQHKPRTLFIPTWLKVAAIVLVTAGLTWLAMFYYQQQAGAIDSMAYNEIIVPIGEKSQVILSDGTQVWINSGSHFKYPTQFSIQSREVLLSGEAFFDVTHRQGQPFKIFTKDSEIKVLGTAFNVKSYPDEVKTETTVLRGLVSVQGLGRKNPPVLVRPKQALETRTDSLTTGSAVENTITNNVNVDAVTNWKDQALVFADEPLEDMAVKMERWFNVQITITDDALKKERYNGKFANNETVYQVLKAIKLTTPIQYKANGNHIIISRK